MNFEKITTYLDSLLERDIPSIDCIIYDNHKQVYRHMNGTTDVEKKCPINGNEMYLMFSMTKVQTMIAIMQLIERKLIRLDDNVSDYLPAYGKLNVIKDGKISPLTTPLKLKHLVSMCSGLNYDLNSIGIENVLKKSGSHATTRELVDSFTETPLMFVPGEHFMYSLSHDVVGAIIEVVSEMRFGEYLQKNIWEPLGMNNTYFAKPVNNHIPNLATQFICDDNGAVVPMDNSCCYQLSENYESGGAGLASCTSDYAVFADTIACGGISKDGIRIINPETIELMKQNLLCPAAREDIANTMGRTGYGYGCGVQVLLEPELVGSTAPKGVFGWDGAAGSCVTMDTASKRSVVYVQHVRNCGMAFGEIHPALRDLVFG